MRERLVSVISSMAGIEIVGPAENTPAVSQAVERFEPDVVVMDVGGRPMAELLNLRNIKQRRTNTPVVILCVDDSSFPPRESWRGAGADFVFHRSKEFKKVFKLIREMAK